MRLNSTCKVGVNPRPASPSCDSQSSLADSFWKVLLWEVGGRQTGGGVSTDRLNSSGPEPHRQPVCGLKLQCGFPPAHVFRLNSGKNVKAGRGECEHCCSPLYVAEPTGPRAVEHVPE